MGFWCYHGYKGRLCSMSIHRIIAVASIEATCWKINSRENEQKAGLRLLYTVFSVWMMRFKKSFILIFSTSLHYTKSFSRISCSHALALCNLLYLISALICRPSFITDCSAGPPELFSLLWSMENENDFWRQTDISIIQYSPKVSLHRRGENRLRTLLTHFRHLPFLSFFFFFAHVAHPEILIPILWICSFSSSWCTQLFLVQFKSSWINSISTRFAFRSEIAWKFYKILQRICSYHFEFNKSRKTEITKIFFYNFHFYSPLSNYSNNSC